jgi:hypothetical protein
MMVLRKVQYTATCFVIIRLETGKMIRREAQKIWKSPWLSEGLQIRYIIATLQPLLSVHCRHDG